MYSYQFTTRWYEDEVEDPPLACPWLVLFDILLIFAPFSIPEPRRYIDSGHDMVEKR